MKILFKYTGKFNGDGKELTQIIKKHKDGGYQILQRDGTTGDYEVIDFKDTLQKAKDSINNYFKYIWENRDYIALF